MTRLRLCGTRAVGHEQRFRTKKQFSGLFTFKRAEKMQASLRNESVGWEGVYSVAWQSPREDLARQIDELDEWQLVEGELDHRFEALLVQYAGDESEPPDPATLARAKSIASELTRVAQTYACPSPLPTVSRAEEGSIDLFWRGYDCSLLMNISSEPDELVSVSMREAANRNLRLVGELEVNQRDINTLVGWLTGGPRR